MTAARCSECGRDPNPGDPRPAIVHEPGCSVGLERNRATALGALEEAARRRAELEGLLEHARETVRSRIEMADEAGCSRTAIAEAAMINRSRLYAILATG